MTVVWQHTGDGATDGLSVAQGVSTYGDAFTGVSKVGNFGIAYSTEQAFQGTTSIKQTRTTTSDNGYMGVTLGAAIARMQARAWLYMDTLPANAQQNIFTFRNATTFMGYLGITSAGKFQCYNTSNTGISASLSTATVPLSQWIRVEAAIQKGTGPTDGTIEYGIYVGNSTTPTALWSVGGTSGVGGAWAGQNTGTADPIQARFGLNGATAVPAAVYWDLLTLGDAAGFIGPQGASPPTAVVDATPTVLVDARDSTVPSGTLSYSITQTSGPAFTPALLAPGLWTVDQDAASARVYNVTVTGSLGGSDVESVTVPALTTVTAPNDLVWTGSIWK